ncbi:MAG TPA: hypothetical protein CFH82_07385 [Sulfurospirillum sp. UBA12182]|nr:MAG TPA: hypothetical protein CFH82_07385 [Sulfurospirillum sp. UBA12182]
MSQISLLDKLITRYKVWTIKFQSANKNIKSNILQDDTSSIVEEKIISVVISSALVYIGISILGLFGVYTGGFVAGVVLFAIGWSLSKFLNKKIFGTKREVENLNNEEQELFAHLDAVELKHLQIREKINTGNMIVNFTQYGSLKREFSELMRVLGEYDISNLAYKYRLKYPLLLLKQKQIVDDFHQIYANKKRG